MKDANFLTDEIKNELSADPKKRGEYLALLARLVQSEEWKFLISFVDHFRNQIIENMKLERENKEWIDKLIAVDLLKSLPFDLTTAINMFADSQGKKEKDGFGFNE